MNPCESCALRLFNTKCHNLQGIGNTAYGNVIVVPNVDYDAYKAGDMSFSKQVEIIQECMSSTGVLNLLDYVYIVPLIRCNTSLGCQVNDDIYKLCIQHFIKDCNKYKFKNILLLGEAAIKIVRINIGEYNRYILKDFYNHYYSFNYSPLVKYTNEYYYEQFKKYLIKWYNFVVHDYNTFDSIIYI